MSEKSRRRIALRKIIKLADIPERGIDWESIEREEQLEEMRNYPLYRRKPLPGWKLIRPKNKLHRKQLKEDEDALGISALV